MNRIKRLACVFVPVAILGSMLILEKELAKMKRASGEFPQEVYIWQRVWSPAVKQSIENRVGKFDGKTVLVAEFEWSGKQKWGIQYFPDALSYTQKHQSAMAIRIGSRASLTKWNPAACEYVVQSIRSLSALSPKLQIDYDCPSSKLKDYILLLKAIHKAFPQHELEITVLPDWINYEQFKHLIAHTDRYVVQVHGVSGHGAGYVLCDTTQAYDVAERCGNWGIPFLVALPTYRHAVRRDDKNNIIEVLSEGASLVAGGDYEVVSAHPEELADLIDLWKKDRPAQMVGVIWYRLPVEGESMNWTWETLLEVMQGKAPKGELTIEIVEGEHGELVLNLFNNSTRRLDWPRRIQLNWEDAYCVAFDAGADYRARSVQRGSGLLLNWNALSPRPVAPGQRARIGWFRFHELTGRKTQVEIITQIPLLN